MNLRKDHYHTKTKNQKPKAQEKKTGRNPLLLLLCRGRPADYFIIFLFGVSAPISKTKPKPINSVFLSGFYDPFIDCLKNKNILINEHFINRALKTPEKEVTRSTLSATDVLAPTTMKNAAKCDTSCELQNPVSHQNFERNLRFLGSMSVGVSVHPPHKTYSFRFLWSRPLRPFQ